MTPLPINATMGDKIRYYRKQVGWTQKELAEHCGLSESAIRNYELGNRVPDYDTLQTISDQLEVTFYALCDTTLTAPGGAIHALYDLEALYGLHPIEVDGHIHFVFRDSVPVTDFQERPDIALQSASTMLQSRAISFARINALHDSGKLDDEEYAVWKSKFPVFQSSFQDYLQRKRQEPAEQAIEPESASEEKSEQPKRRRKRKVNNGRG